MKWSEAIKSSLKVNYSIKNLSGVGIIHGKKHGVVAHIYATKMLLPCGASVLFHMDLIRRS
jgi:hypothetical protein